MEKCGNLASTTINMNPIPVPVSYQAAGAKFCNFVYSPFRVKATSKRNEPPLHGRKIYRNPRRLIRISTAEGRWLGNWSCDYVFSLRDLQLEDLAEDDQKNTQVFINLYIHKHASFGLSVDGRIITSFTTKCSNCSSSYCRQIDTAFNVWILQSTKNNINNSIPLPEIGGDDPSVIYVKPGYEADLDTLIQDTIRLTASVKETCSETCEKSKPILHYIGGKKTSSIDKRWSRLLELRKQNL